MYNGIIGCEDKRIELMKKGEYLQALDVVLKGSDRINYPEEYNKSTISFALNVLNKNKEYYGDVVNMIEQIYGFSMEVIFNLCLINGSVYNTISYDTIEKKQKEPSIGMGIGFRANSNLPIGEDEDIPGFLLYENGRIFAFSYSRKGIVMRILDFTRTFENEIIFTLKNYAEEMDVAKKTTFLNAYPGMCFLKLRDAFEKAKCEYMALLGIKKPSIIVVKTPEEATIYKKYYNQVVTC